MSPFAIVQLNDVTRCHSLGKHSWYCTFTRQLHD